MPYSIAYLADHPEHVRIIGKWYWQEWDRHEGWNIEQSIAYAKEGCHKDKLDLTLIALNEKNECVGTIQAMKKSFLNDFQHLSPWLGSFYISPAHRRNRVAFMLYKKLMEILSKLDIEEAHAFTPNLQKFFTRHGGQQIGTTDYAGKTVNVFSFSMVKENV